MAFDVYIIHCHIFVYDYIINQNFPWIDKCPIGIMPFVFFGTGLICYFGLSCIGIIRSYLFNILKIKGIMKTVVSKLDRYLY